MSAFKSRSVNFIKSLRGRRSAAPEAAAPRLNTPSGVKATALATAAQR